MGNRIFVPSTGNAGLGDTETARNRGEAETIARRHIDVALVVTVDKGWMAFESTQDYATWKKQK